MTKKQEMKVLKILGLSILISLVVIMLNLPVGLGSFIAGFGIGFITVKIK